MAAKDSLLPRLIRSKLVVWFLIVVPGLWPAYPIFVTHDPTVGADPLKYILHHQGFVACILLVTVLSFTPLRVLFPKSAVVQALNRHRRLVGVSAFFYGALHYLVHIRYEGGFPVYSATLKTDLTKPFLITGMLTLTVLFILAVTSLHVIARKLGGRRWKNLHRLAYFAAALAAYHQAAAQKLIPAQVFWIFGTLAALEGLRILRQRAPKPAAHAPG